MILNLLFQAPLVALAGAIALILSLTFHEFAHALVGKWRGDDTAERMGRLTLNPLAHMDPLGTLMLLIVGFGWAKPVPFDPRKLKSPLVDGVVIALAGPLANLLLASIAAAFFRGLETAGYLNLQSVLPVFLIFLVLVNLLLLFFNLIPVPPLDGSKVLEAVLVKTRAFSLKRLFEIYGPNILLGFVILSLLTPLNVFFFIIIPSFFACDQLLGHSCAVLLTAYAGG